MNLNGQVAIVTGSAQGIGKAIAMKLAGCGADLCICDIDEKNAEATAKEIEKTGRQAIACAVNVSDIESVEAVVKKTLDKFNKIDILVNNAGITRDGLLIRMKDEDWDLVMDVNLKGTFNFIKAAAKVMMKQRNGRIVNVASVVGIMGNAGQANYSASKGGVIALTKSCAKELSKRNINVNAVAPGFISTRMTEALPQEVKDTYIKLIPLSRFGEADEVADVVLFLVSELSRYVTGEVIKVDGGMVM